MPKNQHYLESYVATVSPPLPQVPHMPRVARELLALVWASFTMRMQILFCHKYFGILRIHFNLIPNRFDSRLRIRIRL